MNKKIIIVAIGLIIIAVAATSCMNKNEKEETVIFPVIDENVISEMENGKHTGYFDSEEVLMEYLSQKYPDREFEVKKQDENKDGYKKYIATFKDKNEQEEILLKETTIKLNNEETKIWCVVENNK